MIDSTKKENVGKIKLAIPLKLLSGKEAKDGLGKNIMLNETLANTIVSDKNSDPVYAMILAQKIYNENNSLEFTEKDHKIIESALKGSQLTILIEAQIRMAITRGEIKWR